MKIVELPKDILRQKSVEVKLPLSTEDEMIAQELIAYIDKASKPRSKLRPGIGIAAVQLGYLKRMFYIRIPFDNEVYEELLINPVLVAESEKYAALEEGEGCLSVPEDHEGTKGLVHRKDKIIIKGYSYMSKQEVEITHYGFLAIVFQHELDHLDGKLFFDRIDQRKPNKPKEAEHII